MRRVLHDHRRVLVGVTFASVPLLAALAILALGWDEALHVLRMAMAILGGLLFLKATIVFLSVGIRLVR